jgi:hypothetical protein
MTDKEEKRQPGRVPFDFQEAVPEFVVTRQELRQLARYWYDERIVHDFWFFIYQTTGGSDLCEHFMIKDHLSRLTQVLGRKAMQEAWDDAVKSVRERNPDITDEDWRVFTSGTEDEQHAWRVKVLEIETEERVVTAEEARQLHAAFGTRHANDYEPRQTT